MQLSIIQELQTMLDTPIPKVGKVMCFIRNFKINTIKEPATPPANKENPQKRITLATHVVRLPLVFKKESLESLKRLDFSIELTIIIPEVEQMNGIQSVNVICIFEALTVLEYIAASIIAQNPIAYNAPDRYTPNDLSFADLGKLRNIESNLNNLFCRLMFKLQKIKIKIRKIRD